MKQLPTLLAFLFAVAGCDSGPDTGIPDPDPTAPVSIAYEYVGSATHRTCSWQDDGDETFNMAVAVGEQGLYLGNTHGTRYTCVGSPSPIYFLGEGDELTPVGTLPPGYDVVVGGDGRFFAFDGGEDVIHLAQVSLDGEIVRRVQIEPFGQASSARIVLLSARAVRAPNQAQIEQIWLVYSVGQRTVLHAVSPEGETLWKDTNVENYTPIGWHAGRLLVSDNRQDQDIRIVELGPNGEVFRRLSIPREGSAYEISASAPHPDGGYWVFGTETVDSSGGNHLLAIHIGPAGDIVLRRRPLGDITHVLDARPQGNGNAALLVGTFEIPTSPDAPASPPIKVSVAPDGEPQTHAVEYSGGPLDLFGAQTEVLGDGRLVTLIPFMNTWEPRFEGFVIQQFRIRPQE